MQRKTNHNWRLPLILLALLAVTSVPASADEEGEYYGCHHEERHEGYGYGYDRHGDDRRGDDRHGDDRHGDDRHGDDPHRR
jgi:hypothetical protein